MARLGMFANIDKPMRRPPRSETRDVVKPVLDELARQGFLIAREGLPFETIARILAGNLDVVGVLWRQNTGVMLSTYKGRDSFTRFGLPGQADIIGLARGGRFVAIECKHPDAPSEPTGRRPTSRSGAKKEQALRAQLGFREMIRRLGGIAIVATGRDSVADFRKAHAIT